MKIFICSICMLFCLLSVADAAPSYMQKKNKVTYGERTFLNKMTDYFSTTGKDRHEKKIILKNKSRKRIDKRRRKLWDKQQRQKEKQRLKAQKKLDKKLRREKKRLRKQQG